jgi:hypothetical protein
MNPNSTLELGQRPLNWGKNGLSHPQFKAPAVLKNLQKCPKIEAKFQRPTSHKPPPTKKLKTPVDLGYRSGAPALPAFAKRELCFWSPWSFSGAWKLAVGCFNRHQGYPILSKHKIFLPSTIPPALSLSAFLRHPPISFFLLTF